MTLDDLKEIEARAKAATAKRWLVSDTIIYFPDDPLSDAESATIAEAFRDNAKANAAHIAGMDPTTTLALTAALREAWGEVERLREALAPSGETKAAYIGEFSFAFPAFDDEGNEVQFTPNVPWTTIKEIMAAIVARALSPEGGE